MRPIIAIAMAQSDGSEPKLLWGALALRQSAAKHRTSGVTAVWRESKAALMRRCAFSEPITSAHAQAKVTAAFCNTHRVRSGRTDVFCPLPLYSPEVPPHEVLTRSRRFFAQQCLPERSVSPSIACNIHRARVNCLVTSCARSPVEQIAAQEV